MPTIRQVYQEALSPLYGIEEMAVRLLLLHTNQIPSMTDFFLRMEEEMTNLEEYRRLFARVLAGEPVQYVLEKASFFGLNLFVDQRVLIPRPETEEMVEKIIQEENQQRSSRLVIADIGTGSGCIAFALEKAFKNANLFGVDFSSQALEVAEINKKRLASSVRFMQGNLLEPLLFSKIRLDILVSNPPYIAKKADVAPNVIDYEPHSALFAPNGIDHYITMMSLLPSVMNDRGRIYFEINHDQEKALEEIIRQKLPTCEHRFLRDMQGKTRFLFILYRKD